jgi:hypothetical protein
VNGHVESIYLNSIAGECEFALKAIAICNFHLNREERGTTEFFEAAQDFLQHSAVISKTLWPSDKKAQSRGQHLRSSLGIDDSHPLKDRRLRNHLEHYDERLDDWANSSLNHNMVDKMIVNSRSAIGGDIWLTDGDILRLFETDTMTFVFRGESFDMQKLCDGVVDVKKRSTARLKIIQRN